MSNVDNVRKAQEALTNLLAKVYDEVCVVYSNTEKFIDNVADEVIANLEKQAQPASEAKPSVFNRQDALDKIADYYQSYNSNSAYEWRNIDRSGSDWVKTHWTDERLQEKLSDLGLA